MENGKNSHIPALFAFPLEERDKDRWFRYVRPLYKAGKKDKPGLPTYFVLSDNVMRDSGEQSGEIKVYDNKNNCIRRTLVNAISWMPVFRDTNTDGFPDYIAKGTTHMVMVDLFNEKRISIHDVQGACYGGLPVDVVKGYFFFVGDNAPHLWHPNARHWWSGHIKSDYLNIYAAILRKGTWQLFQPTRLGYYFLYAFDGTLRKEGRLPFTHIGTFANSFWWKNGDDEQEIVLMFGKQD